MWQMIGELVELDWWSWKGYRPDRFPWNQAVLSGNERRVAAQEARLQILREEYVLIFIYNTYMAKLTLNVDSQVVSRAKHYAKGRGVSVSAIVEAYLSAVSEPPGQYDRATPVLRSVRGILRGVDIDDYRQHLESRYR